MVQEFTVSTRDRVQFINIDNEVFSIISSSGIKRGLCIVYVPHTTAGVTINENADPDVGRDIKMELNKIIPFDDGYMHSEGNSAAHIKSSIVGASETVIIENGSPVLGTWQSLFFCEFDGPRRRKVIVKIFGK